MCRCKTGDERDGRARTRSESEWELAKAPGGARAEQLLAKAWRHLPSFAVSTVFHAIVLLALALPWTTLPKESQRHLLTATIEGEDWGRLDDLVLEAPLPDVELQHIVAVPVGLDPGVTALGEPAEPDGRALGDAGMPSRLGPLGEIGMLFGEGGQGWATADEGTGGAEFYGVKARGDKFVFVVDNSRSMSGARFEAACRELHHSVCRMAPEQSFYVFLFSNTAYPLFYPNPAEGMIPASDANKQRLRSWFRSVGLMPWTNAKQAVLQALAMKPDAIYILTDGDFTDDTYTMLMVMPDSEVAIHTVGMELKRRHERSLQAISKKHHGTYRLVRVDARMKGLPAVQGRKCHTSLADAD